MSVCSSTTVSTVVSEQKGLSKFFQIFSYLLFLEESDTTSSGRQSPRCDLMQGNNEFFQVVNRQAKQSK